MDFGKATPVVTAELKKYPTSERPLVQVSNGIWLLMSGFFYFKFAFLYLITFIPFAFQFSSCFVHFINVHYIFRSPCQQFLAWLDHCRPRDNNVEELEFLDKFKEKFTRGLEDTMVRSQEFHRILNTNAVAIEAYNPNRYTGQNDKVRRIFETPLRLSQFFAIPFMMFTFPFPQFVFILGFNFEYFVYNQ